MIQYLTIVRDSIYFDMIIIRLYLTIVQVTHIFGLDCHNTASKNFPRHHVFGLECTFLSLFCLLRDCSCANVLLIDP